MRTVCLAILALMPATASAVSVPLDLATGSTASSRRAVVWSRATRARARPVAADAPETALAHVLRYSNADRFRALDGDKTLSTHWHLADTVQAIANGFDWTPPFTPVLKAMGVDASMSRPTARW